MILKKKIKTLVVFQKHKKTPHTLKTLPSSANPFVLASINVDMPQNKEERFPPGGKRAALHHSPLTSEFLIVVKQRTILCFL